MSPKHKRVATLIALFLILAITQVYVAVSFAGPSSGDSKASAAFPQGPAEILTTRGNKPITVNGATAISGATILSGAIIETPDKVGATVNLGSLGTLDIAPNTKLKLEFDQNSVKVTLIQGCIILKMKKGTTSEVFTEKGIAGKTDESGGTLNFCYTNGMLVGFRCANCGGAAAGVAGGLSTGAIAGIIIAATAGTITAVALTRGRNPSPFTAGG